MNLADHRSLIVWAEFPVSLANLDPNKLKNFITNLSLSSYLHSHTYTERNSGGRSGVFLEQCGANVAQWIQSEKYWLSDLPRGDMCYFPGQCDIAHIFARQVASGCN